MIHAIDKNQDLVILESLKNGLFAGHNYGSNYNVLSLGDARSKNRETLLLLRVMLEHMGYTGQIYFLPDYDKAGMAKNLVYNMKSILGAKVVTMDVIAIDKSKVKKGYDIVDLLVTKNVDEDDLLANYKNKWFDLEDTNYTKLILENTGSGKTTRALIAMVKAAIEENKQSAFIVPDVATIKQIENKDGYYRNHLMKLFNINNDDINSLFGFYYGDKKILSLTKIKIVTQSKWVSYIQKESYLRDDIEIYDEAHTMQDSWRTSGDTLNGISLVEHIKERDANDNYTFLMTGTESMFFDEMLKGVRVMKYDRLKSDFAINTEMKIIYDKTEKDNYVSQVAEYVDR